VSHEPPRGAAGCHCSGPNQKLAWSSAQLLSSNYQACEVEDCEIEPCGVPFYVRYNWHPRGSELIRDSPNVTLQRLFLSGENEQFCFSDYAVEFRKFCRGRGWCSNIGDAMRRDMYQGYSCSASICTPRGVTRCYPIVAIL
jgi:hypothetical protein